MFRAIYQNEGERKKVCGWVKNKNQTPDSPNPKIPGSFFSAVVVAQVVPTEGVVYIGTNNELTSVDTTTARTSLSEASSAVIENNISRWKEVAKGFILRLSPVENQITGIHTLDGKFAECEDWIKKALLLMKEGVDAIRACSDASDAFTVRTMYERKLDELPEFPEQSLLDSLEPDTLSIPKVAVYPIVDDSGVIVGNGSVIDVVHRVREVNEFKDTFSNISDSTQQVEPNIIYDDEDRIIDDKGIYDTNIQTYGKSATLTVDLENETNIRDIQLTSTEGGNIYFVCDDGSQKLFTLNEKNSINHKVTKIVFKIPKRVKSIGPLVIAASMGGSVLENYSKSFEVRAGSTVHIEKDNGIYFTLMKDGARHKPVDGNLVRTQENSSLLSPEFSDHASNTVTFTPNVNCQLFLTSTDLNPRSINIEIEHQGDMYSYTKILDWQQVGALLYVGEKMSGELLVTKI